MNENFIGKSTPQGNLIARPTTEKEVCDEFVLWETTHPDESSFSYHIPLAGDVNNDGKVDIKDIATVARAYGSQPSDWNWNPIADLNKDGKVDIKDVAIAARNFGKIGSQQ